MDSDLERKLRVLIDKDEIRDVLVRCARGTDRGDPELLSACYHPDAIDDHGGVELTGAEAGPRFGRPRPSSTSGQRGQHFLGNISIDVDGDVAWTESYFIAYGIVEREGAEFTRFRGARFLDRFERRQGAWRIAYRVVVDDWDRLDRIVELAPMREMWRRGNAGKLDPSAQFRSGEIGDNESAIRERLRARGAPVS